MQITILIDNRPSNNSALVSEHGFSALVTTENLQILVDAGLSGRAFDNAEAMGLDISRIHYLVLSHGHNDHTGGLRRFLEINNTAKIIAPEQMPNSDYWSDRGGKLHSLSPDIDVVRKNAGRFVFREGNIRLSNDISVVAITQHQYPQPVGNRYLYLRSSGSLVPYTAKDECALCINNGGRLVIISPCSHNGLMNIAHECSKTLNISYIAAYIGGLHLLDGEADDIQQLTGQISDCYPEMNLYTGHCTGNQACQSLAEELQERLHVFKTGEVISLL